MPVLNVTLDFSVDDGIAEEFTFPLTNKFTDGIYDSAEGNPAGSVRCDLITLSTTNQTNARNKTFEQWGVPAGATITNVNNLSADVKRTETGTWGPWDAYVRVYITAPSFIVLAARREDGIVGARDWTAVPFLSQVGSFTPMASTDFLRVSILCNNDATPTGTAASVYYDNINFDVTYTDPVVADSTGTGALQSQDAKMEGAGFAADIIASGALQAQSAVIAGYAQSLPSTTEVAKKQSTDTFTLNIDGVSVPLISFTVKREVAKETARVVVPGTFEDILASAAAIAINLKSVDASGAETNTQIFSGTLDDFSTLDPLVTGNCSGAASWPASAVRYFENVSYYSDNGNGQIYRACVDASFYPGDVGMFGVRRINVTRVTISSNGQQSVMELSSFG